MTSEPRVLIIEDDDVLRAMLFTILRYQPVSVDTASDANDALEKVSSCDYALIVIDAGLADGACEAFLTEFRSRRPEATSCVIAIRDPQSETCLDSEIVTAVLNKPIEIQTLADLVRECAVIVPQPDDPLPCPPAESTSRSGFDRSSGLTN